MSRRRSAEEPPQTSLELGEPAPPRLPPRLPPRIRGRTGDLFEHFGVRPGPAATVRPPPRAARATACRACGWIRARAEPTCPLCGLREPPEGAT